MVIESYYGLGDANLLQPDQRFGSAAKLRRDQWHRMAGGRAGQAQWGWIGLGALVGFVVGLIAGLGIPGELPPMLVGLAAAPLGAFGGHVWSRAGSYYEGMVLIIVNERRSRIRKEVVTAQAEAWVPKPLVAYRSQDWRYAAGRPYLWLMLPFGARIHETLLRTDDYLTLSNDYFRAKDAAVYAQRSWNRMVSDNGDDYAHLDDGESDENRMVELLPWIAAAAFVVSGVLMVLLTME